MKSDTGWSFDTRGGVDEIRVRRIGRNELAVMQTLLAIYDAQRDYSSEDRDGDGLRQYAARLKSSPGKHDGLYWPTRADERQARSGRRWPAHGLGRALTGITAITTSCSRRRATYATGGACSYRPG